MFGTDAPRHADWYQNSVTGPAASKVSWEQLHAVTSTESVLMTVCRGTFNVIVMGTSYVSLASPNMFCNMNKMAGKLV